MTLFEPSRHQRLESQDWDQSVALAFIKNESKAIDHALDARYWKKFSGDDAAPTSLYEGAMPVVWALHFLSTKIDYVCDYVPSINLVEIAHEVLADFDTNEGQTMLEADIQTPEASYFLGKTGMLRLLQDIDPASAGTYEQTLIDLAKANTDNPTLEALWGCPGSVIPIVSMLEKGIGNRSVLVQSLNDQCEYMRSVLNRNDAFDCDFWTQDLYGRIVNLTGAGHGFVGNVYPFIRARQFLVDDLADWVVSLAVHTAIKTAAEENGCANWQTTLDMPAKNQPKFLVQWCHGAPGVIISLNNVPVGFSAEFDELLLKAGETVWQAGPLDKNLGLCHGTDGNGFAFLKLYERTGDEKWLFRARAFAMHAIKRHKPEFGVWIGNTALCLYLWACITGDANVPTLD